MLERLRRNVFSGCPSPHEVETLYQDRNLLAMTTFLLVALAGWWECWLEGRVQHRICLQQHLWTLQCNACITGVQFLRAFTSLRLLISSLIHCDAMLSHLWAWGDDVRCECNCAACYWPPGAV